jgi:dihydroorotase
LLLFIETMQSYLIKNINLVNEGKIQNNDVLIVNDRISRIDNNLQVKHNTQEINGEGKYLLPGVIDDQVHFREPGLTHKADIYTESRAAVAGGTTSFMEMPNTMPPAFTQELLEDKYQIAAQKSLANYSFFMGTSNQNWEEALRTNNKKNDVCGIKIFMGSSTGGLLVDNYITLNKLFNESELLIATHCEDENIIQQNLAQYPADSLTPAHHPLIRDEKACYQSSFSAIQLAKQNNTRLHILHISTSFELNMFTNMMPLADKQITSEVCVHHLHFTANDYEALGYKIKCNPAIKAPEHKEALWNALLDDRLDIIATDHAPHLLSEKQGTYFETHAGLPLVQHSLLLMWHYYKQGKISLEKIVEKMCHAPAICFNIKERGYLREGYFADMVIVNPNQTTTVQKNNIHYKCGWSPLEGFTAPVSIEKTFISGHLAYDNGVFNNEKPGQRLRFNRA